MCKCNCPEETPGCRSLCSVGIAEAEKRKARTETIKLAKAKEYDLDGFKYAHPQFISMKGGQQ